MVSAEFVRIGYSLPLEAFSALGFQGPTSLGSPSTSLLSGPSPPRMLGPPYMSELGMREIPWLPLGCLLYLFDLSQSYGTA